MPAMCRRLHYVRVLWAVAEMKWRQAAVFGAPDRIRTCDLRLRRATLYPAELRVPVLTRCLRGKGQDVNLFLPIA